jgi:hypothetical protein
MLDLSSTAFHLNIESVETSRLEYLSLHLFDQWQDYVDRSLALSDYSLLLHIEEGSVDGWAKVKTTAKHLAVGITAVGGLISGIGEIQKQLNSASNFIATQVQSTFSCPDSKMTIRRKGGAPASLQRLFTRVQLGELTPEEATILAKSIMGNDEQEIPGFFDALYNAFKSCPRHPQQENLPFEDIIEPEKIPVISSGNSRKSPNRRLPENPPSTHYQIEVWRDSKGKKKQTKTIVI